jgi:hypothetical protein
MTLGPIDAYDTAMDEQHDDARNLGDSAVSVAHIAYAAALERLRQASCVEAAAREAFLAAGEEVATLQSSRNAADRREASERHHRAGQAFEVAHAAVVRAEFDLANAAAAIEDNKAPTQI